NDFGGVLEDADQLAFGVSVAPEYPRFGLLNHLFDARQHDFQFLLETVQGGLLHYIGGALHLLSNFLGEALGLPDHSAGRVHQLLISFLQSLFTLLAFAACCPRNLQNPELHAAAAIAQLGADVTSNICNLLHRADQHSHSIAQQAAVSRVMDIRLNYRCVHPHLAAFHYFVFTGKLDDSLVNLL